MNEFWHSSQTMLAIQRQRNLSVNCAMHSPGDQRGVNTSPRSNIPNFLTLLSDELF